MVTAAVVPPGSKSVVSTPVTSSLKVARKTSVSALVFWPAEVWRVKDVVLGGRASYKTELSVLVEAALRLMAVGRRAGRDVGDDRAIAGHAADGDVIGRRPAADHDRRRSGSSAQRNIAGVVEVGDILAEGDSEVDRAAAGRVGLACAPG